VGYQFDLSRGHNSAVECVLHTDEVTGSNPVARTKNKGRLSTHPILSAFFVSNPVVICLGVVLLVSRCEAEKPLWSQTCGFNPLTYTQSFTGARF
jgi:hypothetical protein